MQIKLKLIRELGIFRPYAHRKRVAYLLYGTRKAVDLFNKGIVSFMADGTLDYCITSMGKLQEPEILLDEFYIEAVVEIDKETFEQLLHHMFRQIREHKKRQHGKKS